MNSNHTVSKEETPADFDTDLDVAAFTEDPEIGMSSKQIEKIHAASPKHVAQFVQNLAVTLYGADELRTRTVTTKETCTKKNKNSKPISPAKMNFIYRKALERAAMDVGSINFAEQQFVANKTVVNRAIAEKISNLRKAYKLSLSKNV
ncbi:uncharacterized protein LOC129753125 [Uranotaenia lowii]|uniref:uncharacterized protein LOC129753125 n=1 Tax=Uranotaenia lowii TaxID=190385 RepID=UPI00247A0989|nr:uncharacterized protein LOC129753125 [Uranotaenia lowii]